MPTYEYLCKSCGERLEVQQSFADDALTVCPSCTGPLRKLFGSVGITFKGSGFYRTDSRGKPSSGSGESSSSDGKSEAKSESTSSSETKSESKSETKSESKSADSSTSSASSST